MDITSKVFFSLTNMINKFHKENGDCVIMAVILKLLLHD